MSSLCFSKGTKGQKGQIGDAGKGLPGHDGHQGLRGNFGEFSHLVHLEGLFWRLGVFTLGSVHIGVYEYGNHARIRTK